MSTTSPESDAPEKLDFIREIIRDDLANGVHETTVTRFPPEPNGYLHIGHAKSICLNFGLAEENAATGARCHLRFDDTNPAKESDEYVRSIQEDVKWLGFDWGDNLFFASNYFERFYECAMHLIDNGLAYVDRQSPEEIRQNRGTLTQPGTPSPDRDSSPEANRELFEKMRAGEFKEGEAVLRAKIDLASQNLNLRDPVIYRIMHHAHHNTGDAWCIYPMYDFAHPLEDAFEHITHSLCTLEFEDHRPLYEWVIENCPVPSKPRQIEFSRLNVNYTVMSKRKLLRLVAEECVTGWDDPRMPTISGLRRRGVPPEAIRSFCRTVGLTKFNSTSDIALFEHAIRDHLNKTSPRYMAVLDPLKVTLTNWDEDRFDELRAILNPEDPEAGDRAIPFGRSLFIEREDFLDDENPPRKFFRLAPGREVRLRYAYVIKCEEVVRDEAGNPIELLCTVDHDTLGKNPEGRKVKGVIHWVSADRCVDAPVRLYDRLFTVENPEADVDDFTENLNLESLDVVHAKLEPALAWAAKPETRVQFERVGYFVADRHDSTPDHPIFNRTVGLRDSWAKAKGK
ncbi:glutamine--tRNA ligase/YqeY domain fusion protein [Sulfuriroseicoccus oceanibius]|uniref:Glutamine--tRNA ligase n=1 Tax=Sulfuriroseicoccus oceanibius TaxID=2707525 RepID=A0A6B3LFK1_9BACT|nr:glutamine--tRNA ligase/YqeY domain fusion protein [Sulfuriroseicoccus oceanibius]QQL45351.1 glutamine--tRNA ligase/YqeY domain fusion protein [Sulfuriroseicoccus oceanibius]